MFGNYKGYYKRRNNVEDRINFLEKEWFEGRVCLDIGCNEGLVTVAIAERFQPRMIVGLDTDKVLIETACSRVKRIRYQHKQEAEKKQQEVRRPAPLLFKPRAVATKKPLTQVVDVPSSSSMVAKWDNHNSDQTGSTSVLISTSVNNTINNCGSSVTSCESNSTCILEQVNSLTNFTQPYPFNMEFVRKDVFELSKSVSERYDAILCLSVTKWIHLYHGDDGLMRFFRLVYHMLRVGGVFILEYQQWKSYKKRKKVSEDTEKNFDSIQMKPDQFEHVLIHDIKFEVLRKYDVQEDSSTGFSRPILILKKATI